MKISLLKIKFIVVLSNCILSLQNYASADDFCPITKLVRVEDTERNVSEVDYRKKRNRLLDHLLTEAVERVNGVETFARSSSKIDLNNDVLNMHTRQKNIQKSQGFVKSYSFPSNGEEVLETESGLTITLRLDVIVCDHSNLEGRIFIAVGRIDFKNFEKYLVSDLSDIVASGIPPDSNIFTVKYADNSDQYYDYLITGKILSIGVTREVSGIKAVIGNVIRANGKPIVESRSYRLSAMIVLKADNSFDDTYTIVNETIEKQVSYSPYEESLERYIDEFITDSLEEASKVLFLKIRAQKDFRKLR
jgi:hypothetical protein